MCNGQAFVLQLFSGQVLGQLPNRVLACQACAAIEVESFHVFVAFVIHFFYFIKVSQMWSSFSRKITPSLREEFKNVQDLTLFLSFIVSA